MSSAAKNTAADTTMLHVGDLVDGKYKILNKIGQGGMSVVWLAMNERANKQWAIKEVRKDGVDNYEVVKQSLVAEVEYLKRLNHPNLPSIIDIIESDDSLLIVMDYIEGVSLSQILREQGAQSQDQVANWAKQLCAVLGYLHSRKPPIIYRDLKPANIMLEPDGTVKIIDFGTAREFKEGRADDTVPLGTQGYAAPEQYGNHQTDARTDVYNLGATMYHLVSGHNPSEPPYVMYPIRQWNSELSSGLEAIIIKCTNRDPEDRYQNMAELLFDLERFHQLDYEYIKGQNRKWKLFISAAVATLVFIGGAIGFGVAESVTRQNSYDTFVARAEQEYAGSVTAALTNYVQATKLDPIKEDAYNSLIGLISRDGVMSSEENEALLTLLGNTTGQNTNRALLENQNPVAYGKIQFEVGKLYYFLLNGYGNKTLAADYLENAAASETLPQSSRDIASRLAVISRNYERIINGGGMSSGVEGLFNDESFTAGDYWRSLTEMCEGDLLALTGNSRIVIEIYRDAIYQISQHSNVFINGGVSLSQINALLNDAVSGLRGISTNNIEDGILLEEALAQAEIARERAAMTSANSNYSGRPSSGSNSSGGA